MEYLRFEIPEATPSNNVVMRMHHRQRTKEHERWTWMVSHSIGMVRPNHKTCKVEINRHSPRMLDWDNMGGGCKFLLDAMVKNKIIEDDNPNCITELVLKQHKSRSDTPILQLINISNIKMYVFDIMGCPSLLFLLKLK